MYKVILNQKFSRRWLKILVNSTLLCPIQLMANEPEANLADHHLITVVGKPYDHKISVTGRISSDPEIRLYAVGYHLAVSNGTNCDFRQMMTGFLAHDLTFYDTDRRSKILDEMDLTTGFSIIYVVKKSVAAREGFKAGDQIMEMNGNKLEDMYPTHVRKKGSDYRTRHFEFDLSHALSSGPVELTVRRLGKMLKISLTGQIGCGGLVRIDDHMDDDSQDLRVNSWYDGISTAYTTRLINFAKTDDQLAFVVAHEMAHILNGDFFKKVKSHGYVTQGLTPSDNRKAEIEADQNAVKIVYSAGYNPQDSLIFLDNASHANWLSEPDTHPAFSERINTVSDRISFFKIASKM